MTYEEFINLDFNEKLDFIARKLIFDKLNSGGINEVFTREAVTPVQPKTKTPEGFEAIFGAEPDKSNSAHRAVWLNQLKSFGGLIPNFTEDPEYSYKSDKSHDRGLGVPIGYIFNGEMRVTFSRKPEFWRPIDWYNNYYNLLLDAARNG